MFPPRLFPIALLALGLVPSLSSPALAGTNGVQEGKVRERKTHEPVPGVDEQLLYEWSHKTNAGKPFYDYLPLEPVVTKSGSYLESPPVRIGMTGTVQIFRRIPPFAIPFTSATITYQVH